MNIFSPFFSKVVTQIYEDFWNPAPQNCIFQVNTLFLKTIICKATLQKNLYLWHSL